MNISRLYVSRFFMYRIYLFVRICLLYVFVAYKTYSISDFDSVTFFYKKNFKSVCLLDLIERKIFRSKTNSVCSKIRCEFTCEVQFNMYKFHFDSLLGVCNCNFRD